MRESALQAASDLLSATPSPEIVFVGSISRTWYEDHNRIVEVLDWLQLHNCLIRVGGRAGFDLLVERLADVIGACVVNFGPDLLEERLQQVGCPEAILVGATLVVAFPSRKEAGVFSADPIVELALAHDIPVLGFEVDGSGSFVTLHNQIYM